MEKNTSIKNELLDWEEKYRLIFENSAVGIFLYNHEGIINECNTEAANIFSSEKEDILGINAYEAIKNTKIHEAIRNSLTGQKTDYSGHYKTIDGQKKVIKANFSPIITSNGTIPGAMVVVQDITKQYNAEIALQESMDKLTSTLNSLEDVIIVLNEKGIIQDLFLPDGTETNFPSKHEAEGKHYQDVFPEHVVWLFNRAIQTITVNNNFEQFDFFIDKDATKNWFRAKASKRFNAKGEISGITFTCRDISKRKLGEYALKESERKFKEFAEMLPVFVYETNKDGFFTFLNNNALQNLGLTLNDLNEGRNILAIFSDGEDIRFSNEMKQSIINKSVIDSEYVIKRNDHTTFPVRITGSATYNINKFMGFRGVMYDISEIKKTQEVLMKAKERAELSDKLKSAFLANMSHELRSPMNAIIGFSDLLLNSNLTEEEKNEYLTYINSNGKSLLNLINDIIDIAKIEVGQIKINKTVCKINEVIKELKLNYVAECKIKNKINLEIQSENGVDDSEFAVNTDPYRLRQILRNLIGNALKFTDTGFIRFGYQLKNGLIEFFVKDTGIGISKNKLKVIFERFGQDERGFDRNISGAGLGLAISKNLVKLLGGQIWVESEIGEGTTFYFTIPDEKIEKQLKTVEVKEKKEKNQIDWTGVTILVAEDEEVNFRFLEIVLKRTNAKVIRAKNGKDAIEKYKAFEKEITIILMDIQMPILNGYEAIRIIRQENSTIPIIAQTAFAMSGEKEKTITAGCNNYISKPIKPDVLISMIDSFLTNKIGA